jgi:hypothetical protein
LGPPRSSPLPVAALPTTQDTETRVRPLPPPRPNTTSPTAATPTTPTESPPREAPPPGNPPASRTRRACPGARRRSRARLPYSSATAMAVPIPRLSSLLFTARASRFLAEILVIWGYTGILRRDSERFEARFVGARTIHCGGVHEKGGCENVPIFLLLRFLCGVRRQRIYPHVG